MREWPIVEKWGDHSRDLSESQGRFRRSDWNYFIVDQKLGALAGYWLAESGHEDLGEDDFDEILHVIEGRLYVTGGEQSYVAEPGDTVVVHRGRPMRVEVREPSRVFFVCYGVADPEGYELDVRRLMKLRKVV